MNSAAFSISRLPRIEFGAGGIVKLPALITSLGKRVLLVTGAKSYIESSHWGALTSALEKRGCTWEVLRVTQEPSPQLVDQAAEQLRGAGIEVVAAIGGGSVVDAAKAIAGLLRVSNSVMDYLEGVGAELPYEGPAVPFIAVPTTAGTGSEATKNAVLSVRGEHGFKKSFRHESLVPRFALVDPDLLAGCPPPLIAANGMDAITQLLESYVSIKANPVTDALALDGLKHARDGLFRWYENAAQAVRGRADMAYAALLSGVTLAQVGLGSVHGLASPLGAFFPIPHGVVCGTLVGAATEINIRALRQREQANPALTKYAQVAALLTGNTYTSGDAALKALIATLREWTARLDLPRLGAYGIERAHFPGIIAHCRGSSMKTNPIVLTDGEVQDILADRL
ncbi:MAG: iron-containing alcohol dehydrogenase [Burkholderiales bacterium]